MNKTSFLIKRMSMVFCVMILFFVSFLSFVACSTSDIVSIKGAEIGTINKLSVYELTDYYLETFDGNKLDGGIKVDDDCLLTNFRNDDRILKINPIGWFSFDGTYDIVPKKKPKPWADRDFNAWSNAFFYSNKVHKIVDVYMKYKKVKDLKIKLKEK